MAHKIKILKGNRQLQDVEKTVPDTRVNLKAILKYPVTDLVGGMIKEKFTETDEDDEDYDFFNPDEYEDPDAEEDAPEGSGGEVEGTK